MPMPTNPSTIQAMIRDIRDNPNVTHLEIAKYYDVRLHVIQRLATVNGIYRKPRTMKSVQPDQKRVMGKKRINPTVAKIIKAIRSSGHAGVTLEVIASWTGVSVGTVLRYTNEIPHPNRKRGFVLVTKGTGKALSGKKLMMAATAG